MSPELGPSDSVYSQSLIGILRLIMELGWVDIFMKILMKYSNLVLTREGNLEQAYHIFACIIKHHNLEIVFDDSDTVFDKSKLILMIRIWLDLGFLKVKSYPEIYQSIVVLVFRVGQKLMHIMQLTISTIDKGPVYWYILNGSHIFWTQRSIIAPNLVLLGDNI